MGELKRTYLVCYQKYLKNRRKLNVTIQVPEKSTNFFIENELKKAISNIGTKVGDLQRIKLLDIKLLKEERVDDSDPLNDFKKKPFETNEEYLCRVKELEEDLEEEENLKNELLNLNQKI